MEYRVEIAHHHIVFSLSPKHRESWQNIGAILNSKAEVTSFTLEVGKQLGMHYNAPPLPVTLKMSQDTDQSFAPVEGTTGTDDLRAMFQQVSAGFGEGGSMM